MPKKISITLLFTVAVAIVALFAAAEVRAECTQLELDNYECFVDDQGYFEVRIQKPFPLYDSDFDTSTYTWIITKLSSPYNASHFDLIIERNFEDKIVDGGLDCDGSGEASTDFAKYLTWNCYYKWDPLPDPIILELSVNGKFGSAPSDYLIKAGSSNVFGIIQAPAPFCVSVLGDYTPAAVEEVMTIKSVEIKILRNPTTGCGIGLEKRVKDPDTGVWGPWETMTATDAPTVGDTQVVDCGEITGNSGCLQECIFTAAESPGWSSVNLGGTWYKVWIP